MPRLALDTVRSGIPDRDVVRGAMLAADADPSLTLTLVGPEAPLHAAIAGADVVLPGERVRVQHAARAVGPDDDPVVAVRGHRDASVRVALDLLARDEADAAISAGPIAATVTAARFAVGRVPGLRIPGLAVRVHLPAGELLVVDAGSEPDATTGALVRYGELGARLAAARGVATPRVAALEPLGTSSRLVHELEVFFDAADLGPGSFLGAVPTRRALDGSVDVLVTGGAAGRILVDTLAATTDAVDPQGVLLGAKRPVATLGPADPEAVADAIADVARLTTEVDR